MLPMGTGAAKNGQPSDLDIAFYRARARTGVGLIITGGTSAHPLGLPGQGKFEPFRPDTVPGFKRLADVVHAEGGRLFGQLTHLGRESGGRESKLDPGWAPSAIPSAHNRHVPHAMSTDQIGETIASYAISASTLAEAEYDGIEIAANHGYLVAQFLSPLANERDDEYGGSFDARMRFLLEIVSAVRRTAGAGLALGVRLSGEEGIEGGLTLKDSIQIAKALKATGNVDYLSVTVGVRGAYVKDMSVPVGAAVPAAAALKAASQLLTLVGQRITHPTLAEDILTRGAADLIGLARSFITDHEWARKAREGRPDQIRPCVGSMQECRNPTRRGCVHSPEAYRETTWDPDAFPIAPTPKVVVIVGGGPAGLEAAIVSARRGHSVTLIDRGRDLGGQLRLAARAPNRAELEGIASYRASEAHRLGVRIQLNEEATVEGVLSYKPDAVIVASGARAYRPEIDGIELPHVLDIWQLFGSVNDSPALLNASSAVVVDDGSGTWEAYSAAEYLAARGIQVELVTPSIHIGSGIPEESLTALVHRLSRYRVRFATATAVSVIEPSRVLVYDMLRLETLHTLEERKMDADVVVVYGGKRADDSLLIALRGCVPELHAIGDCVAPRGIAEAVYQGYATARDI